ncbi:hypothetical protein B0H17DRAFT_1077664 [Mycena rosella]|uniref:DUF6593 domain-containing protein n=1 Tax=Mycena rosella TaxID=1033263 RepID=A0AAD7D5E0_MYCRO|nr:hypothetical protein B0H17DRAFT_1077664 [Mycena rosella]
MSTALTFAHKNLLASSIAAADGIVHYTTSTTRGLRGRKSTTIRAADGLVGTIKWRDKTFVINGVQREWRRLKSHSGEIFSSGREWKWGNRPYTLKYHNSHKELLATPTSGGAVCFTTYQSHLFRGNKRAAIYFLDQLQDEIERMFPLMAILQTEIRRQDDAGVSLDAGISLG